MNKIILEAEGKLEDKEARQYLDILAKRIENINNRTKRQTLEIRELRKQIKELSKKK